MLTAATDMMEKPSSSILLVTSIWSDDNDKKVLTVPVCGGTNIMVNMKRVIFMLAAHAVTTTMSLKATGRKAKKNKRDFKYDRVLRQLSSSCTVTVVMPVAEVILSTTDTVVTRGETFTVTATVLHDNAANKTTMWTSSNAGTEYVSDGTVTAIALGTTIITVGTGDGGKQASCITRHDKTNMDSRQPRYTRL